MFINLANVANMACGRHHRVDAAALEGARGIPQADLHTALLALFKTSNGNSDTELEAWAALGRFNFAVFYRFVCYALPDLPSRFRKGS